MSLPPVGTTPVLRALTWWFTGLLLATAALLLAQPSTALYLAIARTGTDWPDLLANILIIALSGVLALMTWRRRKLDPARAATGLAAGIGAVAAYVSSEILKLLVGQDRPCRTVLLDPGCPSAGNLSFPSNHATIAFALATAVVLITSKWWAWSAYLAALITAAARVVDGVHFPHDILAGAILGTCTTMASAILLNRRTHALIERLFRPYPTG